MGIRDPGRPRRVVRIQAPGKPRRVVGIQDPGRPDAKEKDRGKHSPHPTCPAAHSRG
ncbi:hypothetical protein GCM10010349_30820 [Streptomyces flavofungini]|nr:hypothetical protein GCM10010349_30820 [Streptomyces flavofungini]